MRSLIIGIAILSAFGWGLTSGFYALLAFNWVTFMRPHDFDWSFWNNKPLFQMACILLLVVNLAQGRLRPRITPFLILFLIFFAWIVIGCALAYNPKLSWSFFRTFFVPFPILFIIITGCLRSLEETKYVLWVMMGSIGLIAFKTGLVFTAKGGGHITDQINGFVGDNNVLALSICLALAGLMGLRNTVPRKKIYRYAFYFMVSMILMTVLYTKSRGAFVTLGVFLLISAGLSGKPVRNTVALLAFVSAAYFILPGELFSRLGTLANVGEDTSAMGRVEMWGKAVEQAVLHPVFGVGVGGFQHFNISVWPNQFWSGHSLVTHSVYFQVLSTTGFGGLALYLAILGVTWWNLHASYRLALRNKARHPSVAWVVQTAFWMRNGFVSYLIGSGLLDMLVYDTPWYFMLYSSLLHANLKTELMRQKAARRKAESAPEEDPEETGEEDPGREREPESDPPALGRPA